MKFILIALFLPLVASLYSKGDDVISITPANFEREVMKSTSVVLLEFFAPWCHCKSLSPKYKNAAKKLKGLAKVVAIDCDDNKDLCGRFGVKGFPTLKIFGSDKSKPPLDYEGARETGAMVDAVLGKIPSFVKLVTPESLDSFITGTYVPKVILFTEKKSTPPLFKAFSAEYKDRLAFGEVRSTSSPLKEKFGVESFPAVVVVSGSSAEEYTPYKGEFKPDLLKEFFSTYAPSQETSSAPKPQKVDPNVYELNSEDEFKKRCLEQKKMCMISFWTHEPEFEESVKLHNENLALLKQVNKDSAFTFLWVNVVNHGKQLMHDLDVSDILPGLVAINVNRGWYRQFRGGFDQTGIAAFIKEINSGKGRNFKLGKSITLDKVEQREDL